MNRKEIASTTMTGHLSFVALFMAPPLKNELKV
jgi:hypothetical protein